MKSALWVSMSRIKMVATMKAGAGLVREWELHISISLSNMKYFSNICSLCFSLGWMTSVRKCQLSRLHSCRHESLVGQHVCLRSVWGEPWRHEVANLQLKVYLLKIQRDSCVTDIWCFCYIFVLVNKIYLIYSHMKLNHLSFPQLACNWIFIQAWTF